MSFDRYVYRLCGVLVAIVAALLPGGVLAAGPENCIVGNNDYTISIVAGAGGQFPIVINDNTSDLNNYCDNTSMSNYPCTVFRYAISPNKPTSELSIGYQKGTITYPICPSSPLEILNVGVGGGPHDVYSPCDTDIQTQPHHWYDSVCGIRAAYYTSFGGGGGTPSFYLAVKGKNLGQGVISAFLSDQDIFYRCVNKDAGGAVQGGILGPGCPGEVRELSAIKVKTQCMYLEGTNYRMDLDNGFPTELWDCGADTQCSDGSCTKVTASLPPSSEICLVFEDNPSRCWSLTEIGSINGDTSSQTGYAAFADSPGCIVMLVNGVPTKVPLGCR